MSGRTFSAPRPPHWPANHIGIRLTALSGRDGPIYRASIGHARLVLWHDDLPSRSGYNEGLPHAFNLLILPSRELTYSQNLREVIASNLTSCQRMPANLVGRAACRHRRTASRARLKELSKQNRPTGSSITAAFNSRNEKCGKWGMGK